MLGQNAISEKALADDGVLLLPSSSLISSFTASQAGTFIGITAAEMSAIAIKLNVGVNVLVGLIEASANFTLSSELTRFATGISAQVITTTQSTTANNVFSGVSEQDFNFTQSTAAAILISGVSQMDFDTIQSALANAIRAGVSEQSFEFIQSALGSILIDGASELSFSFIADIASSAILVSGETEIVSLFVQSTFGELLWVKIDPNSGIIESWTPIVHTGDTWVAMTHSGDTWVPITHSGDTWTEINADVNIESWTNKVV